MYKKILLTYDGSAFGQAVLRQGAELATAFKAELHLLGIAITSGGMALAQAVGPGDVWGEQERTMQSAIDTAAQALRSRGLTVIASVRAGDPAIEILTYAREAGIDLIVLGHTNKSLLTRLLEGSVGARLLAQMPCSLLIATGID